jgi:hypothetical protein
MKTRLFLSIFLSICSLGVQAAPPQPTARPVNPALLYWQAAACLPKLSAPQTEELRDMARGKRPVDRRKLNESGFGEIERLLRKATLSEAPCDWGLSWEKGPGMPMSHLSKLTELATLAVVNAELLLSEGKAEASLEYFMIAHRIARHAAADPVIIGYLVQTSINAMTMRAVARHVLDWAPAIRESYLKQWRALPPEKTLPECYAGELAVVPWYEKLLRKSAALPEAERARELKSLWPDLTEEQLRKISDPAHLARHIEELYQIHQRRLELLSQPWSTGKPGLDRLSEECAQSENEIVRMLNEGSLGFFAKSFVDSTFRTMFEAALEHGSQLNAATAASYRDTFVGQPLRLETLSDRRLRLLSAEPLPKDQPVELVLGRNQP